MNEFGQSTVEKPTDGGIFYNFAGVNMAFLLDAGRSASGNH
jgi:hypothetical protein